MDTQKDVADPEAGMALPERLTMHSAAKVLAALDGSVSRLPGNDLLLDARGLRVMDSSAVAVLLELRRRLGRQGKTLTVRNPPQRLRDLIVLYGVSELLPV